MVDECTQTSQMALTNTNTATTNPTPTVEKIPQVDQIYSFAQYQADIKLAMQQIQQQRILALNTNTDKPPEPPRLDSAKNTNAKSTNNSSSSRNHPLGKVVAAKVDHHNIKTKPPMPKPSAKLRAPRRKSESFFLPMDESSFASREPSKLYSEPPSSEQRRRLDSGIYTRTSESPLSSSVMTEKSSRLARPPSAKPRSRKHSAHKPEASFVSMVDTNVSSIITVPIGSADDAGGVLQIAQDLLQSSVLEHLELAPLSQSINLELCF